MNNTQIPIDELYDQLTLILQEEKYAKSTIQLYQEHVKRIKKFMLANNITDYLLHSFVCIFFRST